MFKSIKSIVFIIILVIILIMLCFIPMFYIGISDDIKYSKDVNIYQLDERYLQVVENIVINIGDADVDYLYFPISIFKEYKEGNIELIDKKIMVNSQEILSEFENERLSRKEIQYNKYNINNTQLFKDINRDLIYLENSDSVNISSKSDMNFKSGEYFITVTYKCNINDVITNYNNMSILKVRRNTKFDNLNVIMTFPKASSIFRVNSKKAIIEKNANNVYKVNLSDVESLEKFDYVGFVFENNMFLSGKRVNQNYDLKKETGIFANEDKGNIIYFSAIAISTVILFIITIYATKNIKIEKEYVRDTKNVISPILAESLIDRKIGSKELIMACIVELTCKGNIQNIDNNKFKLISRDNLLYYEEQLIDLIFGKKDTISFSGINKKFLNNNKGTATFVKQFKQIKKKILDKLFCLDIYSKEGEKKLEQIRDISLLIYVNVCVLINCILDQECYTLIAILVINIGVLLVIKFLRYLITENKIIISKGGKSGNGFAMTFFLMIILICVTILVIYAFNEHYIILTMLLVVVILNTTIFRKSKLHILTPKGQEEFAKAYGLKSYILDFSLMQERDVDSSIIWDEYLAYAVAFSIPNKITDKFNAALMESNIILQKIDKFMRW